MTRNAAERNDPPASSQSQSGNTGNTANTANAPLTMSYRDNPRQLPPGTTVTIMVIEREGPQSVYADLLVNPTCSDTDTMITVDCILRYCHQKYLDGRTVGTSYCEVGFWSEIEHLLQECRYMLETHSLTSEAISKKRVTLLADLGRLCQYLMQTLRQANEHSDPTWQRVDSDFGKLISCSAQLHEEARAWSCARRREAAQATEPFPLTELSGRLGGSASDNLLNHDDFAQACQLAEEIGLDMQTVEICMYKKLEAVIMLSGSTPPASSPVQDRHETPPGGSI